MQGEPIPIVTAESVTILEKIAGKVLVAGSHGGIIAAYLGATAGAHALILNDAGLGKDRAGISGLFYLEDIGMAAAAVDCMSARIGDGADMLTRGIISHANAYAALCGVVAGQSCRDAAERLRAAPPPRSGPPPYAEGRWRVTGRPPDSYEPSLAWLARYRVPHQSFNMVDKYSRFSTENTVAIRLDELAQREYCWAVEDSLPMAQFLATQMKLPVALIDCPWNRVTQDHVNVGRYADWPTLAAQMPKSQRR